MIPESLRKELLARIASAITPREAAVDTMKELQRHYGWLTDEAVGEAAELLGLTPLHVEEIATFYEMIYRRPVGKRVIHACDSISCWSVGSGQIMAHLRNRLGIGEGGTTADGSKSPDYCSYCFRNGAFTSPEIKTAADMQRFCIGKLKEMGLPTFMAWLCGALPGDCSIDWSTWRGGSNRGIATTSAT